MYLRAGKSVLRGIHAKGIGRMNRRFTFKTILAHCFFVSSLTLAAQAPMPDQMPQHFQGVDSVLRIIQECDERDQIRFTRALFPSLDDCLSLFNDPKIAHKVFHYQKYLRRRAHIVIRPIIEEQTELLLWAASTEELLDYTGEAQYFPGGYHELAPYFEEGMTFYRFKFVAPGRQLGSAFDVLVHVNGHWCLIHRPWTVLF